MTIPHQLKDWRFILLVHKQKFPIHEMEGWAKDRENKTYTADSPTLIEHIKKNGNYGVITGEDRLVLASDTVEIENAIDTRLPKTFSVRSPRHKTRHFYYYGHIEHNTLFKPTQSGDPCCDLKHGNAYVLGPESNYDKYGNYEIVDNLPIATLTEEQIYSALDEFIEKNPIETILKNSENTETNTELDFPISELVKDHFDSMNSRGNDISGTHPQHGSTTGNNFHLDLDKNCWHCFRHHTGGGPLSLLAVLNGIIKCEEATKGALRGEKFKQTVDLAFSKKYIKKKPESYQIDRSQFITTVDGRENPNTDILLEWFYNKFHFITSDDTEEPYYYVEGQYKPAEIMIKHELEILLGKLATTHYVNEILWHIRRKTYISREKFNKFNNKIPVLNGLLNLETLTLEPFTEKEIYTFKINAKYDPSKDCPKFRSFLTTSMPNKDSQNLLQEYSGYTLLPAMPLHKLLMLYGTGRNGKGRYVMTLEYILGKPNVSHVALEELDGFHRFSVANLYGKLMNICSEPSTERVLSTELLKKLTGEDTVDGEKKNIQKPITFQNTAKFIIMGNKYPQIQDETVGFWERINLISWKKQFLEGNPETVPNIEKSWIENEDELSGILNWMLSGLSRLIKNRAFTKNKEMDELIIEFRKMSDPIGSFIAEKIQVKPLSSRTLFKELYEAYVIYANNLGFIPVSRQKFNNRIETIPRVKKETTKEGNVWIGIDIIFDSIGEESERNEENKDIKNFGDTTENRNTVDSSFSSSSSPILTIDLFEEYIEEHESVGYLKIMEDLKITQTQLNWLMSSTHKAKWGMGLQTVNWCGNKE